MWTQKRYFWQNRTWRTLKKDRTIPKKDSDKSGDSSSFALEMTRMLICLSFVFTILALPLFNAKSKVRPPFLNRCKVVAMQWQRQRLAPGREAARAARTGRRYGRPRAHRARRGSLRRRQRARAAAAGAVLPRHLRQLALLAAHARQRHRLRALPRFRARLQPRAWVNTRFHCFPTQQTPQGLRLTHNS